MCTQAEADPAKASRLQITIHKCEGLHLRPDMDPATARPYVRYTAPGYSFPHDTVRGSGPSPVFGDVAEYGLMRSNELEAALHNAHMEVRCGIIACMSAHGI